MESLLQPTINIKPIKPKKPKKPSGPPPPQSRKLWYDIKKPPSSNLNRSNSFYSDGSDSGSGPNPFAAGMNETNVMSLLEDTEFNDPIENVLDRISDAIIKEETLVLEMDDSKHLLKYIQFLDEQTIEAINNPDPNVIYSSNEYIKLEEVLKRCLDSIFNVKKSLAKCKKKLAENDDHIIMDGTGKKKRKRKKKKKGGTIKNNISSIYKMGSCSANSEENFASVPLTGGRRRRRRSRRRRPRRTKKRKSKSRKKRRTVRKRRRRR